MMLSLIRHGRTDWNDARRMQGRADVPLSDAGRAQVRSWQAPPAIERIRWISSPLARAVETAAILSGSAPEREDALVEMDWGEWEGLTLEALRERFGSEFTRNERAGLDFRPPRGESPRDVQVRLHAWLAAIGNWAEPIVAVTHKGVLRAALASATGWDMTGKPPIRLREDALHRFAVASDGAISVIECNVSLASGAQGAT